MTVKEAIAELSLYHPDTLVVTENYDEYNGLDFSQPEIIEEVSLARDNTKDDTRLIDVYEAEDGAEEITAIVIK